ncbi:MAG TPA: hypothetical protein VMF70_15610 [Gemmatimonadales bacterium]|nr:hypothetical protein [Gemmatimonadales bacterium]
MSWFTLVLRVLHVGGGVFWAGATFMLAGFVEPAAAAAGADGGRFVQRLAGGRYPIVVAAVALVSIAAGVWLLSIDSAGFQPAFMRSGLGVTLSIGALCALLAAVIGIGVSGRTAAQLKRVAAAVPGQSGGPSPEQLARVVALQGRLRTGGRLTAMLLGVTVVCMAIARYV